MTKTKRGVLAAAVATMAGQAFAAELTKVTFGTNWLAQAEHGGYYQAVADGTYKACGLDVTIMQGGPQVSGRPMLLAGKIDFYMGGNMLEAIGRPAGHSARVVAADFQKDPQVLMSHPGVGMDTLERPQEGRQVHPRRRGLYSFFQWMRSADGFDGSKRVPYTFNPAPFIADKKSVQQGYVTSEPYAVKKKAASSPTCSCSPTTAGRPIRPPSRPCRRRSTSGRRSCKCFVDGSAKGWYNYLYGDNTAANDLIKKDNPDMTDDQIAFSIAQMKEYGIVDSGDAGKDGIGAMTDARMKDFYDKMVAAKVLPAGIDFRGLHAGIRQQGRRRST